ncbi:MAG: hypothetical protein V3R24_00980 [Gemmatimonadales bacterium]
MPTEPVRFGTVREVEPQVHELAHIQYGADLVGVRIVVSRLEDGSWRGRIVFGSEDLDSAPSTGEILVGQSEAELWQSVHELREYHLRDFYRALTE